MDYTCYNQYEWQHDNSQQQQHGHHHSQQPTPCQYENHPACEHWVYHEYGVVKVKILQQAAIE
jgi:hypothetical protein